MRVDGAEISGENQTQRHAEEMRAHIHAGPAMDRGVAEQALGMNQSSSGKSAAV